MQLIYAVEVVSNAGMKVSEMEFGIIRIIFSIIPAFILELEGDALHRTRVLSGRTIAHLYFYWFDSADSQCTPQLEGHLKS